MNKNEFEQRIMKLSGKDKDGDTWIETRNVEAIFRKFLFELEMEVRSSVFVELQSYTDVIPEQQRDELENAITERVKIRIGHNEKSGIKIPLDNDLLSSYKYMIAKIVDLIKVYAFRFDRSRNNIADEIYAKIVEDLEDLKEKSQTGA